MSEHRRVSRMSAASWARPLLLKAALGAPASRFARLSRSRERAAAKPDITGEIDSTHLSFWKKFGLRNRSRPTALDATGTRKREPAGPQYTCPFLGQCRQVRDVFFSCPKRDDALCRSERGHCRCNIPTARHLRRARHSAPARLRGARRAARRAAFVACDPPTPFAQNRRRQYVAGSRLL